MNFIDTKLFFLNFVNKLSLMGQSGSVPVGNAPDNAEAVNLVEALPEDEILAGMNSYTEKIYQFYMNGVRTNNWGSPLTVGDSYALEDETLAFRAFVNTHKECRIIETGNKGDCAINSCQATLLYYYFLAITGQLMNRGFFYSQNQKGDYIFNHKFFDKGGGSHRNGFSIDSINNIRSAREIRQLLVGLVKTRAPGDPRRGKPYDWLNQNEWIDEQALMHLGNIIHKQLPFNITVLENANGIIHRFPNKTMQFNNIIYPDTSEQQANSSDEYNDTLRSLPLDARGSILLYNYTETHFKPILPIPLFPFEEKQKNQNRQATIRDYFIIFLECCRNDSEYIKIKPELRSDIRNIAIEIERDRGLAVEKAADKIATIETDKFNGEKYDDFDVVSRSLSAYEKLLNAKAAVRVPGVENYRITLKNALNSLVRAGHQDLLLNFDTELTAEIELLAITLYVLQNRYKEHGNVPAIMKIARSINKIRKRFNVTQAEYYKVPVGKETTKK